MPLYEYECAACGHRFEIIQKFSDSPLESCPKCGGGPVHKLQSAPAFHLKGSGWYITDYAKKDQPAAAKSEGGSTEAGGTEKKDSGGEKKDAGGEKKESVAQTEKPAEKGSSGSADASSPKDT